MPELILLRHGKAATGDAGEDLQRRLKTRGKRDIQRLGVWLARQNMQPELVLCSPAERARTSAEKCAKAMALPCHRIRTDKAMYPGRMDALQRIVQTLPQQAKRVMLVGHNPGLEQLIAHFAGRAQQPTSLRTASAAVVRSAAAWSAWREGCAQLVQLQRGRDLPELFPFPLERPSEQRSRPAYYYRQSSIVPYRIVEGHLEVLVTGSSGGKHPVIPKGIIEPGLSALESALKEAEEEAGAVGPALSPALGHYVYEKWGAPIRVEVFAMQVDELLEAPRWTESQRGRAWLNLDQAKRALTQKKLGPLLDELAQRLSV